MARGYVRFSRSDGPRRHASYVLGDKTFPASGPMTVACPKCGSQPGRSCVRQVTGVVGGKDYGGGYTVRLKNPHKERKVGTRKPSVPKDAA